MPSKTNKLKRFNMSKKSSRKFGAALRRSKMAPQRPSSSNSGGSRNVASTCMTPEELCRYDDICTALIIDPYMGFLTHKMNIRFRPLSNQTELKKIVEQFIRDQDYEATHDRLLACDPRRVGPLIRTEREQNLMRQHIYCFLKMFDKDAGFEIRPCERYSAEQNQGGKIVATKAWKKHECISMLVGCIGELTPEQERELLVCGQNDFSVMWSNRKKKSQLWLGPAAYMNHDCKPNCLFRPVRNTAWLQVIRDIAPGDEILLSYGDNFFGVDNCCCECKTCEELKQGAFLPKEEEMLEESGERLRPVPSRISTRAERAMAAKASATPTTNIGFKDNWNGRARRLKANADLLSFGELKKRKITRYDAEIIIAGNHALPEPLQPSPRQRAPPVNVVKMECEEGSAENVNKDGQEELAPLLIDIHTSSEGSHPAGKESVCGAVSATSKESACSPANPCAPRLRGKLSLKRSCKSSKQRSKRQAEETSFDVAYTEGIEPPALSDLTLNTGSTTVPSVALCSPSNAVLCQGPCSFSPTPNGLSKTKLMRKEPVRHSPRLRPRRLSVPSGEEESCCVTLEDGALSLPDLLEQVPSPLPLDGDNEDSGLGEMTGEVCDKSLDSNHNFHEPPVLERQVPYLSPPHPPPSLTPYTEGDDSELDLNRSSSSVPHLPFCGPVSLPPCPSPLQHQVNSRKRKRKKLKNIRIKLTHPDTLSMHDFHEQLEREGKSQFVQIEPKDVKPTLGCGGTIKKENKSDFVQIEPNQVKPSVTCSLTIKKEGHFVKIEPKEEKPTLSCDVSVKREGRERYSVRTVTDSNRSLTAPSKLILTSAAWQPAASAQCCSEPTLPPVRLRLRRDVWQSVV